MAASSRIRNGILFSLAVVAMGCANDVKPPVTKPAVKPVAIPSNPPAEKAKPVESPKKTDEPAKKAEPPKKQEFKPGEREIG